jgi:putative ABC transport system substrate-binding protein
MPYIGMFMNSAEGDRELSNRREAFLQGLGMSGVEIATRFGGAAYSTYLQKAAELVNFQPLVAGQKRLYFATCWPTLQALTKTLMQNALSDPIVFAGAINDPSYGFGPLASNNPIYGFTSYGADLAVQWPGLLKQIAPTVTQAAVIYNKTDSVTYPKLYQSIMTAAEAVNIDVSDIDARLSAPALEDAVAKFNTSVKTSGGVAGLIVLGSTWTGVRRETIIKLAQTYGLPAIYPNRTYVTNGGLISRGAYLPGLCRRAGDYAKQILNGTPPNPPIVNNVDYETVVNRKTAEALGLTVPSTADPVIE